MKTSLTLSEDLVAVIDVAAIDQRTGRPNAELSDALSFQTFAVVSRRALTDSNYSTVDCAPVFSERHGLPTLVGVGA